MLQSKCIARHLKCACVSWCSWSMNRLRIKSPCEVSVWSVEIFRCGDLIYSFRSEIPCSTVGCFFFCCCFCSVCILSTLLFLKKCFFHFVLGFSWFFCMAFGFRSAKQNPKKKLFIWEIETNNNKTFNRWNLCNFFFSLLKFIIYQQWRKKQLCSFFFFSRLNGEQRRRSHNIFTVIKRTWFEFMRMAVPVKGENYRKVVLTRRMNKPRLWYARRIYIYVAFSMLLFMHMRVIMLSKGAAQNKTPQGNAARQTIRQPFLTATYFFRSQFTRDSIMYILRSFQQFSHLIWP